MLTDLPLENDFRQPAIKQLLGYYHRWDWMTGNGHRSVAMPAS